MRKFTINVFGWMAVVEAETIADALLRGRALAPGASLLPSDVTLANVRRATQEDIDWYEGMSGPLVPTRRPIYDLRAEIPVDGKTVREMVQSGIATELGDGSYAFTKKGDEWFKSWIAEKLAEQSGSVRPR